jgi:60 kDa SS-A/Ro ribonucleoprotein
MGGTCLSCCEAEAALALVHLNIEDNICVMAFDQGFRELKMRKNMSLVDAMKFVENINGGGTDCSLPFVWAKQNKADVGAFVTTTDSETWAGKVHPSQALNDYRNSSGNAARSVVVGMTGQCVHHRGPERLRFAGRGWLRRLHAVTHR